jgi:hypothetical protein
MRHHVLQFGLLLGSTLLIQGQCPAQMGGNATDHNHASADSTSNDPSRVLDHTTGAMSSKQVDAGPHMKLTLLRGANPKDKERAQQIAAQARQALEKYRDYHVALNDGYKIFLPRVPTRMKHFTNYKYAMEAAVQLNPEHPTSLLYEQHGQDYKLIGAMFTAPARLTEDELHDRIPLSVAQWHLHVNMCLPPREERAEMFRPDAKFGLAGSIYTKGECEAAGGRFFPRVFGWMVHVYPFEKSTEEIWSVERQMDHKH